MHLHPTHVCCLLPTLYPLVFRLLQRLGGGRVDVSVGSALDIFGGSLGYDEVVAWSRQQ